MASVLRPLDSPVDEPESGFVAFVVWVDKLAGTPLVVVDVDVLGVVVEGAMLSLPDVLNSSVSVTLLPDVLNSSVSVTLLPDVLNSSVSVTLLPDVLSSSYRD